MSNTFVKNAFFYRTNAAPERPTNLLDSSQEQDLLRESVNAIREELGFFSCDRDAGRSNNDELESSAIIPTVQFFDSCDGKCEDEPHFARSAELLKSTDAIGVQLGSIATMMDGSKALMDSPKAAADGVANAGATNKIGCAIDEKGRESKERQEIEFDFERNGALPPMWLPQSPMRDSKSERWYECLEEKPFLSPELLDALERLKDRPGPTHHVSGLKLDRGPFPELSPSPYYLDARPRESKIIDVTHRRDMAPNLVP